MRTCKRYRSRSKRLKKRTLRALGKWALGRLDVAVFSLNRQSDGDQAARVFSLRSLGFRFLRLVAMKEGTGGPGGLSYVATETPVFRLAERRAIFEKQSKYLVLGRIFSLPIADRAPIKDTLQLEFEGLDRHVAGVRELSQGLPALKYTNIP